MQNPFTQQGLVPVVWWEYNQSVDTRTPEERSRIMAAVHSKNTTPELLVRRYLWSQGVRYRIHPKHLPGQPDIAISRCKLAIFVHGCFWHGHDNCVRGRLPKTRVEYWKAKIEANKKRAPHLMQVVDLAPMPFIWPVRVTPLMVSTYRLPLSTMPTAGLHKKVQAAFLPRAMFSNFHIPMLVSCW